SRLRLYLAEIMNVQHALVEDELKANGGHYEKADDWASFVVEDGLLITGQNPASSEEAAKHLIAKIKG
ncbi:MAG: hypothetical protein ACTH9C_03190, partial [Psychrobacter sp.]